MATLLRLRVSEEKYRTAISQLGEKISLLNDKLLALQGKRAEIERNYSGPQAAKAIETIKENENQVRKAIENVQLQKDNIENYLNSMNQTDTTIQGNYDEAMNLAKNIFND